MGQPNNKGGGNKGGNKGGAKGGAKGGSNKGANKGSKGGSSLIISCLPSICFMCMFCLIMLK